MAKVKKYSAGGYEDTDDAKNLILAAEREDVERIGEDFAKTLPKPKTPSFKEAFASARKAGDKTFEYMGKKYTTELASDKKVSSVGMRTAAQEAADDAKIAAAMRKSDRSVTKAQGSFSDRQAYKRATQAAQAAERRAAMGMKKGGVVKSSASKRADGCAQRGKTRGRMV